VYSISLYEFQGLYEWRDAIARAEDESTGYILPNKTLLEIGKNLLKFVITSTYFVCEYLMVKADS
jgi:ribonuclease D